MNPGRGSIQRASVGILDKHVTNRRSQGLPCAFAQQSTLARLLPKRSGRSAIEFADAHVQAITHGELQRLDLRTQHELFDEQVSTISLELAQEALQGLPNGRLYAQGLCVSLVGLLASRHVRPPVVPLPTMRDALVRCAGIARRQVAPRVFVAVEVVGGRVAALACGSQLRAGSCCWCGASRRPRSDRPGPAPCRPQVHPSGAAGHRAPPRRRGGGTRPLRRHLTPS